MLTTKHEQELSKLERMFVKYEKDTNELKIFRHKLNDFKVIVPLVGIFNSGKSSLINALLNETVLKTKIKPETAIPNEIEYGTERHYYLYSNEENSNEISEEEYRKLELNYEKHFKVRAYLDSKTISQYRNIRIVDMPGLDSGIRTHNAAIDRYIVNSLAYIIVIDAEHGTVKDSLIAFLREIKLREKPVFVMINKYDKKSNEIDNIVNQCESIIRDELGKDNIPIYKVSAKKGDIVGFKEILSQLNIDSEEIFSDYYNKQKEKYVNEMRTYIKLRLTNSEVDLSELDVKEKDYKSKLIELEKNIRYKIERLEKDLFGMIDSICNEVRVELNNSIDDLAHIISQNGRIEETINRIVRLSITKSFKEKVEPKLIKFVDEVSKSFQASLGDINFRGSQDIINDSAVRESFEKAIEIGIVAILGSIGIVLSGPILAIIGVIVGIVSELIFKKIKEEKAIMQAKQKLSQEVFPTILNDVSLNVNSSISRIIGEVNITINNELNIERANIVQAIEDVIKMKEKTQTEQKLIISELRSDLEIIDNEFII